MKKNRINILFTFIIICSLFLRSIYLEAASLITKTTFNKMNESLTTFYNNFDENDKYLTNGPFTCSGDRIRCTGSSSIGTLSKKEYEIIGTNSYLSAKNSNNKYWINNTNGSNAYVVNVNSIEEKPQTDSYGIRGAVYVKNETTFAGTGTRIDPYVLNYTSIIKKAIAIGVGYTHSLAIDESGALYSWGRGTYGELGLKQIIDATSPQQIGNKKWKSLSAGYNHSLAIDVNGDLYSWGRGDNGRLGINSTINQNSPQQVVVENVKWKSISAGDSHSLAIDDKGNLYSWGRNVSGQLGDNSTSDRTSPTLINSNTTYATVSAGSSHSMAIDTDGNLYSWGRGDSGELGVSSINNYDEPQKVGDKKWKAISAGSGHSLAIDIDGYLYSWGSNSYGELGLGPESNGKYTTPQKVNNKIWKAISAGWLSSMAIDIDGNLWAWGDNSRWQLGLGPTNTVDYYSPQPVNTLEKWKDISVAMSSHSLGIDIEGNLWAWGYNNRSQLGNKTTTNEYTPYNLTLNGYFGN